MQNTSAGNFGKEGPIHFIFSRLYDSGVWIENIQKCSAGSSTSEQARNQDIQATIETDLNITFVSFSTDLLQPNHTLTGDFRRVEKPNKDIRSSPRC